MLGALFGRGKRWPHRLDVIAICIALPLSLFDPSGPLRAASVTTCVGDCNGSGDVTVNEILVMVNVAPGTTDVTTCAAGDPNHDGAITINEILAAVGSVLNGCVSGPRRRRLPPRAWVKLIVVMAAVAPTLPRAAVRRTGARPAFALIAVRPSVAVPMELLAAPSEAVVPVGSRWTADQVTAAVPAERSAEGCTASSSQPPLS